MKKILFVFALFSLVPSVSNARENISIVGSSTVFPFATAVAEEFGQTTSFNTPTIESTGSGGGLKLFCSGIGTEHPDITNASRKIKSSEIELCGKNGIKDITEVMFGYDGIVLASSKEGKQYQISLADIFMALALEIPENKDGTGKLVKNPYQNWNEVNPNLPNSKIQVFGPPPTSGTRDAFVELVMQEACKPMQAFDQFDKKQKKKICSRIREDGGYIEAGENDNLIVQKLTTNPEALGIMGFSFLDQSRDLIQASKINDVEATFENIASGQYPVSRSLYFYVKDAHIGTIKGLKEYVAEFASDDASGEGGYLEEIGLIPLNTENRATVLKNLSEKGLTK